MDNSVPMTLGKIKCFKAPNHSEVHSPGGGEVGAGDTHIYKSCTNTWTQMFIAALFTIIKRWKQCKCLPTKGMDKQTVVYIQQKYYSALKLSSDTCYNVDEP